MPSLPKNKSRSGELSSLSNEKANRVLIRENNPQPMIWHNQYLVFTVRISGKTSLIPMVAVVVNIPVDDYFYKWEFFTSYC
jgi:hypothetical protein